MAMTGSPNTPPHSPTDPVRRDQDRPSFVSARHQLEEQVRGIGLERQVAQLVNDQQLRPAQLRQLLVEHSIAMRLGQHGDQGSGGDELHGMVLPDRFAPQAHRQMSLAGAGRTNRILPDIRVVRRRSTIGSTRAAASEYRSFDAIGSAEPGCWWSGSRTGRWRRSRRGCARRQLRRWRCASIRGSR